MRSLRVVARNGAVWFAVFSLVGVLVSRGGLYAAEQTAQSSAGEVKIPETAAEHLEMAAKYQEKAKMYLQEVETHQQMLEAYKKKVAIVPKAPVENPWLKKMRKHCERYIKEARALAYEAQELAGFHELQAKVLQGN